jgi:hypothetical protein
VTSAELKELCDEYGWELRGKHGIYVIRNKRFIVHYHARGTGSCEVALRGIDADFVGINVCLRENHILELLTTLDTAYAEELFAAKAALAIQNAESDMRRAKRDQKDIEKMVAGWKKRHAL